LEVALKWSLVVVAVIGAFLGTRFRVPALLAACALIIATDLISGWLEGRSGGDILASTVLLVVTLQCAYLVGLLAAFLWRRAIR
jgi:hypothetical protein